MRIKKKNVARLASISALGAGALGVAAGTAEAGTIVSNPIGVTVGPCCAASMSVTFKGPSGSTLLGSPGSRLGGLPGAAEARPKHWHPWRDSTASSSKLPAPAQALPVLWERGKEVEHPDFLQISPKGHRRIARLHAVHDVCRGQPHPLQILLLQQQWGSNPLYLAHWHWNYWRPLHYHHRRLVGPRRPGGKVYAQFEFSVPRESRVRLVGVQRLS